MSRLKTSLPETLVRALSEVDDARQNRRLHVARRLLALSEPLDRPVCDAGRQGVTALKGGQIDLTSTAPFADVPTLEQDTSLKIVDHILSKPGPLDRDERKIMEKHTVYAKEMLSSISFLRPASIISYCHHERWDGGGYPQGLKGEEIPLPARLFAIVDQWDALSSERPYHKAWPEEKIISHLRENSGKCFDPRVVDAFLRIVEKR